MKRLPLIIWLMVAVSTVVYAATITAPTNLTISSPTTTTMRVSWTLGATGCDSVNIINLASGDTIHVGGNQTNTATADTLTGLNPFKKYILALRIRRNDSTAVSNLDTVYTAVPNVERPADFRSNVNARGARNWRATSSNFDSLYLLTGSTALDSTMQYLSKAYTALQVKAIGHADSCLALLTIFAGKGVENPTFAATSDNNTGTFDYSNVYDDTLNITQAGWSDLKLLSIPPSEHFYIRADGQTGCGKVWLLLRLYRRDD